MKTRTVLFFLLAILCLALSTASAQVLFTSGPINGNLNAFIIDGPGGPFGQSISDEFVATMAGNATTLNFGEWTLAGTPTTIQWALGTTSFGSDIASGGGAVTATFLGIGHLGFRIYNTQLNVSFPLTAGTTYYLTLSGSTDSTGSQLDAWDDNESPDASCYVEDPTTSGGCPTTESQPFTISGRGGTTPEPSTILLFGSGIVGLAGMLLRKLHL